MNTQPIYDNRYFAPSFPPAREVPQGNADKFSTVLDASLSKDKGLEVRRQSSTISGAFPGDIFRAPTVHVTQPSAPPLRKALVAAYAQQTAPDKDQLQGSGWQKYKDDQLLRNPGGDHYYLDENRVSEDPRDREAFQERVGKDLSDFSGNVKNFFGNLLMGSKFRYRDESNEIKEGTQRGLVGTCVDFFKDMGSALTFGLWHPDDEKEPQGAMERLSYFGSKLKKAFLGDLVEGIPQSVNHMSKNLVLAGLNLVQVLPDASIGNLKGGRKLTTTIFDNGQVMVEYLTDVIPSGDAWFRVHAMDLTGLKAPILYNLQMPEHSKGDTRWQYVRNTPFRKTIETIGTLIADIASIGLAGQTGVSTNQNSGK
jgi:hypothetical protein